jgi:hypothetical protein
VANRPKSPGTSTPGGLTGTDVDYLKHIAALLDAGGQIMLGTVKPISNAAVAHDGKKTLAMLRRRAAETVPDLLARLDAAIATAQSSGSRVDEINKPNSDTRYKLGS